MPVTELQVKSAKPRSTAYKLFDDRGLYLLVAPSGGRLWRLKYYFEGREKLISLGRYPEVSIKLARERREEAKRQIALNRDPSSERKEEKRGRDNSVRHIAEEWLLQQRKTLSGDTLTRIRNRLEDWVYPGIGSRAIGAVEAADILPLLRRVEAKGLHETAHRTRADVGRLWRYAVATGRAKRDVTPDLKGALVPVSTTHFAAIVNPTEVGRLLGAIDTYRGYVVTAIALKLLPYLFVRPGELRSARWGELHLDGEQPEWRIPAEKTKMNRAHVVPLSRQAVTLLRSLRATMNVSTDALVFPAERNADRPMSDNTLNAALKRLGFGEQQTAHGFRTIASTLLNEAGWHPDLIELQLAHKERNETRGAYNRAVRIEERRKMMQAWADALDELKVKGTLLTLANRL